MCAVNGSRKAAEIRKLVLDMIFHAGSGHIGGSLSAAEILVSLYYGTMRVDPTNPTWPERDRFILSKGHSVEVYYAVLADLGFFPREELDTFCQFGSRLIGHTNTKVPGVEHNTGSLGHGLSVGMGMALGAKRAHSLSRVFVLMGDGELTEGSVWEAAMAAAHYKLDNLTAIIDRNGLQISGPTENVMQLEPLADKWRAFGWHVTEVSGHDFDELVAALNAEKLGKPHLVLAKTTKGKGISFIENQAHWHHGVPSEEQYLQAKAELEAQWEEASGVGAGIRSN